MMYLTLKLTILILFLPAFISAQICEGKVIDKESGNPFQNANVFLAGTSIGTTTDSNGIFSFYMRGNSYCSLRSTYKKNTLYIIYMI